MDGVRRILIIDKETVDVLNAIELLRALDCVPTVHMNAHTVAATSREDIAAVFVNIDLPFVKPQDLIRSFNGNETNVLRWSTPIIFLTSDRDSRTYNSVENVARSAELNKPIQLEELVEVLESFSVLKDEENGDEWWQSRLSRVTSFAAEFDDWFGKFEFLVESGGGIRK